MNIDVLGAQVYVAERGQGPPLVLLHGNPDSSEVWSGVVDRLQDRYRCLTPDLPGFGRSTSAPEPDYSLAGHAAFVAALLDALDLRGPVHLAGHDFGGIIACAFAAAHGERLRSLTIMDCFFQHDYTWHPWARVWRTPVAGELAMLAMNRAMFVRELRSGSPGISREYASKAYDVVTPEMKRTVLKMYRALDPKMVGDGWEQRLLETTAKVPALVIWGERDPYIPADFAERFGARDVHRLDAGHWVQVERPDDVAYLMGQFLAAAEPTAA